MADIWVEVARERQRAHDKHGETSMESLAVDDLTRLTVLVEEVGEVARWFNEARRRDMQNGELRAELIQVAAMAGAWADALTYRPETSGRYVTTDRTQSGMTDSDGGACDGA